MENNDLRKKLITKILECNSTIKPSESKLLKETDERLVSLLFENAVDAERELWRKDIIKKICQFKPGSENKYKSSGGSYLLVSLIEAVKNTINK